MNHQDQIAKIQQVLRQMEVDGWLFYDFRGSDPIAYQILRLDTAAHTTRRWFYFVPSLGTPQKLVHRIEEDHLDDLPGEKWVYLEWSVLRESLGQMLRGVPRVAMQYSPLNSIPYVAKVDGGTVELVRRCGPEVITSADLLQRFDSVWSAQQLEGHRYSAQRLTAIVHETFKGIQDRLADSGQTTELEVQQLILSRFREEGLETDFPPIVGVNANSGNPHYMPEVSRFSPIHPGDFLLVDLWARRDLAQSVFADITWTAFFGDPVPARIDQVFQIVRRARDSGVEFLSERISSGFEVYGWEVDEAVRKVIREQGHAGDFFHRTGHNLGTSVHGNGVNFDNLETHDTRQIIPGLGCTIEPGIYLEDFGVRSEINIFIHEDSVEITTPPQEQVLTFPVG